MKKIMVVVMVLMVICAMVGANAELSYKTLKVEKTLLGVKHTGEEVYDESYFVEITSDVVGAKPQILEVSKEEYETLLEAEKKAEKKAANASKPWYGKVASFCTFWNPDD